MSLTDNVVQGSSFHILPPQQLCQDYSLKRGYAWICRVHPWGVMGYYRARGRGLAASSGLHRHIWSVMLLHHEDSKQGIDREMYCTKSRNKLCSSLEGVTETIWFYPCYGHRTNPGATSHLWSLPFWSSSLPKNLSNDLCLLATREHFICTSL